jgi:hypothetical protein
MSKHSVESIIIALTRSDIDRSILLHNSADLSDEDLIREIVGSKVAESQVHFLACLSKVLRLMHNFLIGDKPGRQFVQEFSKLWISLDDWGEDIALQKDLVQINHFYRRIHLFCDVPEHRREEPLLFGQERLVELTEAAYAHLKRAWLRARLGRSV